MKFLVFILVSFQLPIASACSNFIAKSDIPNAIANQPISKKCDVSDPCVCFDGFDWGTAAWDGTTLSIDPVKAAAKAAALAAAASSDQAVQTNRIARVVQFQTAISNWATLTAAQKDALQKAILSHLLGQ